MKKYSHAVLTGVTSEPVAGDEVDLGQPRESRLASAAAPRPEAETLRASALSSLSPCLEAKAR